MGINISNKINESQSNATNQVNNVKQSSSSSCQDVRRDSKSQDMRKPCIKSQSTTSLKSRSQSPSVVKFSPQLPKKNKTDHESQCKDKCDPPPFEWIDFRTSDGKIVKGTVLPSLTKESSSVDEKEESKVYEDIELRPSLVKSTSC